VAGRIRRDAGAPFDRRLADQRRRQARRAGFEHRPDFHVLVDLGSRQRGDDGAAVAQEGHQAFGLEVLERFANGDLADVEMGGDLVLPEHSPAGSRPSTIAFLSVCAT
jgi:hypothetical protein